MCDFWQTAMIVYGVIGFSLSMYFAVDASTDPCCEKKATWTALAFLWLPLWPLFVAVSIYSENTEPRR